MGDGMKVGGSPQPADTFSAQAKAVFEQVDHDKDGFLSESELTDALHSPQYKGGAAAAVAVLFKNRRDLEELSNDEWGDENDGVTRADLAAFDRLASTDQQMLATYDYAMATSAIDEADRRLYPGGLASISPAAIHQGNLDDCYFLAALAGLAESDPAAIRRMITPAGGDTYTVRFPGRQPVQVTVTDAELADAASARDGLWVTVIEQAYWDHASAIAQHGGLTGGIHALTGKDAKTYVAVAPFSLDSIREPIQTARAEGRLVVASRTWSTNGSLSTRHVYAVMGYDPASDTLRLKDPAGSEHTLTTREFQAQFDLVAIQDR